MQTSKDNLKYKLCTFHAIILIVLHLIYFNLNWSLGNEKKIIRFVNYIESGIFNTGTANVENDFLFINTSYDNRLIPYETVTGGQGNIVITNRETLGTFFKLLFQHGNKQKYIICDILFDLPSPEDSVLLEGLCKIDKIISPSADYDINQRIRPLTIFPIKKAPAEYVTFNGVINKIGIINTNTQNKTLPLVAYEDITRRFVKFNGLFFHAGWNYVPKSIYPLFYYSRNTIKDKQIDLGTLTSLLGTCDSASFNKIITNKILLIGNIDSDVHITNMGSMPGSLVLFNSFLTFYEGYHLVHWSWFLFSFFFFIVLMCIALKKRVITDDHPRAGMRAFIKSLLTMSFLIILISILSTFLFKVHITILPVIVYVETVKWINKNYIL